MKKKSPPPDVARAPTFPGGRLGSMVVFFSTAFSSLCLPPESVAQDFLNIGVRESARRHFEREYQPSDPDMGWTGSTASGDAGTTDQAFRDRVFDQVNYFRVQAGVLPVGESVDLSAGAQLAAFLMSSNRRIDREPTPDWMFYSEEAREAANKSNLVLGISGVFAINGYMEDPGPAGAGVGHRNWVLRQSTLTMGTGDVPREAGYMAANALWVVTGENTPRDRRSPLLAWPPDNGFTPSPVVYGRWSLREPGGDLSEAEVEMWDTAGEPVGLTIDFRPSGGSGHLVWVPDIPASTFAVPRDPPAADEWYRVRVSGISGSAGPAVEYNVVIFDPAQAVSASASTNLTITEEGESLLVSWRAPDPSAWKIQESEDLVSWSTLDAAIESDGTWAQARFLQSSGRKFYRLHE